MTNTFGRRIGVIAIIASAVALGSSPALATKKESVPAAPAGSYAGSMGYGMGPGMMHGWGSFGMGRGMMHGWGSFGADALGELDLSDDQTAKINKIQDEARKVHWGLMGNMMEQQARLRDLNLAREPDADAIGKAYKDLGDLQQKMIETSLDSQKRIDAILTKEQKQKLRSYQRRSW